MKITPIEIRKKTFEKAFRGYEKEEVDAFLKSLSQEWEKLNEENRELKRSLDNSEKEVKRLREVEQSLFSALKTAENTGANVIEQANRTAELHVREAQILAEGVLNEARQRARNIIEEAEENADHIIGEMQNEVRNAVKDFNYIEDQAEFFMQSLQSLANETLERVDRFKGKSRRNDVERKLKEIKSVSVEKSSSDQEFIKVEVPKIQLSDLPKPDAAPSSDNSTPMTDKDSEVEENRNTEAGSPEEDKDKGSQGSFFDSI